ncbi:uncharacterized protein [Arachis hypogaea]|uniref:uncharacterized protein n=1 Tax=Arachis hypogaea TaxID=3818 RepID=UPI003B213E7F
MELNLQYVLAKVVKGQVIADFLVDRSDNPNDQGTNIIEVDSDCWKLYFDGLKHKDGAGVGILIISPEDWALDLIGIIHPPSSKNHKFILVAIDYFTKWVEAVPLIEAGQNEIIDFIEEYIIHRFEIPQTLSTDQGTMFTGQLLPLEINLHTLRVMRQDELPIEDYWNAMYDELNDLDHECILALENMIHQKNNIARSYNRRVKEKCFHMGELILKAILPMVKKSRFFGKWSHNWEGPFQIIDLYSRNAYCINDIDSGNEVKSINRKYLK